MSRPNLNWLQEGTFLDSEGTPVRAYDDVILTSPIPVRSQGSGEFIDIVPAESIATVLFFTDNIPSELDLECHVNEEFCFANALANNVRLHIRIEEKHPH